MANAEKGEVAINVGGRDLTLVYNYNAVAEIEQVANVPFAQLVGRLADITEFALRIMVWGGLRKYQPALSLADVGDFLEELEMADYNRVAEAVVSAARFRLSKLGYKLPGEQSPGSG